MSGLYGEEDSLGEVLVYAVAGSNFRWNSVQTSWGPPDRFAD